MSFSAMRASFFASHGSSVRTRVQVALSHFSEFVQRAEIVRPGPVDKNLRPARPRPLADIEVAAAVHGEPVRRYELGRTKAGTKAAQPSDTLAGVVDDCHAGTELREVAPDRLGGAKLADVAHRALARRHEQAARPVQVVPL